MFRRKEESTTDSNPASSSTSAQSNGAHTHESASSASAPSAQQSILSQPQASLPSYAPTASASRSNPEQVRPVASTVAYRPTPVAEFNRNIARGSNEPSRPTAAAQPTASHSQERVSEKSASVKPNRRVLTVGNDILLKGEIATCDRLVIEGRVEAKLSDVHTVEIAECGSFKGTAEVEDAEISGVFEGDLVVRNRIVIYATGEVRGNISYGEIEIERGGRLTGQIKTVSAQTAKSKSLEADTKARATKENVAA